MTYGVANKNYRMFRNSFFVVALVTILVLMCIGARFALGYDVPWEIVLVLALLIAGAIALFFSTARWYNEREDIKAVWQRRLNDIVIFLCLAKDKLHLEEVRVIRHLWESDSAQHTSHRLALWRIEEAARLYLGGRESFYVWLVHLQARGYLEFSKKNQYQLSVGEELWNVVREKYRLDDFSLKSDDAQSVQTARQQVETLCKP